MAKYKPMLPASTKEPFNDPGWFYEIKWDGLRIIAEVKKGKALLYDKDGNDCTSRYKLVTNELQGLKDCILDGEIVILDENGRPDFEALQNYRGKGDIVYYVFDLLYLDGESYIQRPLIQRKEMLLHAISKIEILTYNDDFENGVGLYERLKEMGMEGVVAKRKESVYQPGKRSKDWLSIKTAKRREIKKVIPKSIPDIQDVIRKNIMQNREKNPVKGK